MDGWWLVGRALLATVDALAAGLLAALLAHLLVPVVWVSTRVELATVVGGLVTGILLAVPSRSPVWAGAGFPRRSS